MKQLQNGWIQKLPHSVGMLWLRLYTQDCLTGKSVNLLVRYKVLNSSCGRGCVKDFAILAVTDAASWIAVVAV
jgi:hypothetical protein